MIKKLFISILGASLLSGCSYIPDYADYETLKSYMAFDFSTPRMTKVNIQTTKSSNFGAPFYVLIKATNFSNFLIDDYEKITQTVFDEPDGECLACCCIVPGNNQTLKVEAPPGKSIAIYALFTHPGEGWKQFFEIVQNGQIVKVLIGESEITSVD